MKLKITALILITVIITSLFPAAVSAVGIDPYKEITAGEFSFASDSSKFTVYDSALVGMQARNLTDYICFKDVDFKDLEPYAVVTVSATGTAYAEGNIFTIKLDSPDNPTIATVPVTEIGGWNVFLENIGSVTEEISGVHDIYISTNQPNDFKGFYFIGKNPDDILYKPYSADGIYSDISGTRYEREITLISGLGIMGAYEYDRFLPELPVTRAEFTQYVSGLLVDEIPESSDMVFTDVAYDNKYRDAINFLYQKGIVQGNDEKTFNPLSFITARDAAVIILRTLGYAKLGVYKDGYSQVYMETAYRENLLTGLAPDDYLRRETAAKMLYSALDIEYIAVDNIKYGAPEYSLQVGILEKTRNIIKGKDIVNSTAFGGITPGVESVGEVAYIGNNLVEYGDIRLENYLGVKCDYFYREDDDTNTLLSIFPAKGVEQIVLETKDVDFLSISNESLSYNYENGKTEKESIPVSASWIYNNRPLIKDISEVVTAESLNGRIRLIDNGKGIETVFVENYQNIKIRSYDEENNVVYDELSGEKFDFSECSKLMFSDGEKIILPRQIKSGMLAELYLSDDGEIAAILIGESVVSGTVSKIREDNKVLINDTYYKVAKESKDSILLGVSAQFYLNRHGEVVYIKIDDDSKKVGILYGVGYDDDENSVISIMTATNTVFDFKTADKISIEGNRISNCFEDVYSKLGVELRYTPVLYSLNGSGRINMIDTQVDGALNSKDTLTLLKPISSVGYSYRGFTGNFVDGSKFVLDNPVRSNALMLLLNLDNVRDEKCYIEPLSSFYSYYDHQFAFYSTKRDSKIADIVYCNNYTSHDRIEYNFVDYVSESVGSDGITVGATVCFKNPSGVSEYWVSSENETQYKYALGLKRGDFVRIDENVDGEIESIIVGLFADGKSSNSVGQSAEISKFSGINSTSALSNSSSKMVYGTVQSIDDEEGFIEILPFGADTSYWCKATGNILIKISDSEIQTNKPVSDINTGDTVLVRYQYSNLVYVVLYE